MTDSRVRYLLALFAMSSLGILVLQADVSAQVTASANSVAIQGNANHVTLGMNERQLRAATAALMRPLREQSREDRSRIAELERAVGASEAQLTLMLQLAGTGSIPNEERWAELARIAAEYKVLKEQIDDAPPSIERTAAEEALMDVRLGLAGDLLQAMQAGRYRLRLREGTGLEYHYGEANEGIRHVLFSDGWDDSNVLPIEIPQLVHVAGAPAKGEIRFYREAHGSLKQAFAELEQRGLLASLKQWCGSFSLLPVGHYLESHALGIAFDVNCDASDGALDELLPLAETFEKYGFVWGAHFTSAEATHFQFKGLPVQQ